MNTAQKFMAIGVCLGVLLGVGITFSLNKVLFSVTKEIAQEEFGQFKMEFKQTFKPEIEETKEIIKKVPSILKKFAKKIEKKIEDAGLSLVDAEPAENSFSSLQQFFVDFKRVKRLSRDNEIRYQEAILANRKKWIGKQLLGEAKFTDLSIKTVSSKLYYEVDFRVDGSGFTCYFHSSNIEDLKALNKGNIVIVGGKISNMNIWPFLNDCYINGVK